MPGKRRNNQVLTQLLQLELMIELIKAISELNVLLKDEHEKNITKYFGGISEIKQLKRQYLPELKNPISKGIEETSFRRKKREPISSLTHIGTQWFT